MADNEREYAARVRSMGPSGDLAKSAAASADTLSPLIGALAGGGLGYLADKLRPVDEDENKVSRRLTSILAGAALGGVAGHGINQLRKASPLLSKPAPKKKKWDPSWSTMAGAALMAAPAVLFARGKYKEIAKALKSNRHFDLFGNRITPREWNRIVSRAGKIGTGAALATGGGIILRNQMKKDAQYYASPNGTDLTGRRYGLSKATRDSIYSNVRQDMANEADLARKGGLHFRSFRDPITGRMRFPIGLRGSRTNVFNSSMTPSQANFVSLLTKNRGVKNHMDLTRAIDRGRKGFDFMGDPSTVNLHSGKLTRHGQKDLEFAFKHVYGRDPTQNDLAKLNKRMDTLLGTHAGANGTPYRFEAYLPRTF